MKRKELDTFVAHHKLSHTAVEAALDLSRARPSEMEIRAFIVRLLRLAGVLSLAAGIVFFIAANWDAFQVFGRFALLQSVLVSSAAIAFWKPPPHATGRYALLMAFIMTGALLALFGQTYQTGADVYELFLTWTMLGLAFAIAGQWSVTWAAWLLVLNVALALFCGWRPETGLFWILFSGWNLHLSWLLLGPMILNLLLWASIESLQHTRWSPVTARWLGRLALSCAIGFGTWAGTVAIFQPDYVSAERSAGGALALLVLLAVFFIVAVYTLRKRSDVFPLTLIAGSLIVLTTSGLGKHLDFDDTGIFFVLALWLIASSTVSGRLLMKVVHAWRDEADRA